MGSTYLFITLLRNSVKHSKHFCLPTLKIAHSISSATDSTISQSNMDSVCGRCAADFMNLILKNLKYNVDYILSLNVGTRMYFDLLFFFY